MSYKERADTTLFRYPFWMSEMDRESHLQSQCYVDKETNQLTWVRSVYTPPDAYDPECDVKILYQFIDGKWLLSSIGTSQPLHWFLDELEKKVGTDPLCPKMWGGEKFKDQRELVRTELDTIRIQSFLDAKIEEYGINHKYISDGHHTFEELYKYRMAYHALAVNGLPAICEAHKSKHHHDGKECFGGGWFVVSCKLNGKLVSNHYRLENWDLFKIPEEEREKWPFDPAQTPQKQLENLMDYLKL